MKQQGQIAIITLFSLAVFVVIGGSIVTQIVFEQKKAVLEEKSRQAYYAAESGIESALQSIINNQEVSSNPLDIGDAAVQIQAVSEGASENYVVPTQLYPGESFYLNLSGYATDEVRVCWDKAATGIVATYFYRNGTGVMETNTYAFNSLGSSNITNAIDSTTTNDGCGLSGSVYSSDLSLPAGTPAYLLVWVAYQDNVQLAFQALNGETFAPQNTIITSTAKVSENEDTLTRELTYSVSQVGAETLNYPPAWLTVPVYAEGSVTYARE